MSTDFPEQVLLLFAKTAEAAIDRGDESLRWLDGKVVELTETRDQDESVEFRLTVRREEAEFTIRVSAAQIASYYDPVAAIAGLLIEQVKGEEKPEPLVFQRNEALYGEYDDEAGF